MTFKVQHPRTDWFAEYKKNADLLDTAASGISEFEALCFDDVEKQEPLLRECEICRQSRWMEKKEMGASFDW